MGDVSIYKWFLKMEEHKRRGDCIINYPETDATDIEQDLFIKGQRTDFWEKHHRIPERDEISLQGSVVEL